MRLLALDQSTRTTGFSVFEDEKLIYCDKFTLIQKDMGERLCEYRTKIASIIQEQQIDEVIFEDVQMQHECDGQQVVNNVDTFQKLAEVFGVTEELLTEMQIHYQVIASSTWKSKLGIKGKKRTEQKQNTQAWVKETFGMKATQDECDSVCIGASLFPQYTKFTENKKSFHSFE